MATEPLEVVAGKLLAQRGWHLAVAESCTGGLIGHFLTNVPGSSNYFLGGITAYSNGAKVHLLGVHPQTLDKFGAVSRETVLEMAQGVRNVLASEVGLSVSGIAGPTGGTPEKPVGTVWIGLSLPDGNDAWCYILSGNRLEVKEQAVQKALFLLADHLMVEHEVEVTAHFDDRGNAFPINFLWEGRRYLIDSTGRRWVDEKGQHILVMIPGGRTFEMIFAPLESRWYLIPIGMQRMPA